MRPQDLLHKIGFDFSLVASAFHPMIDATQVGIDGGVITADISIKPPKTSSREMLRFICKDGKWMRRQDT